MDTDAQVNTADLQALATLWQTIARRNQWELIEPAELTPFLYAAAHIAAQLDTPTASEAGLKLALQRAYSERLYQALTGGSNQASHELWQMAYRVACKRGFSDHDAQEVAQEAVTRVLERLATVHTPQGFISWALMICRTVRRDVLQAAPTDYLAATDDDASGPAAVPDASSIEAHVEQHEIDREIVELVQRTLTKPLERTVVLRVILLDHKPQQVAADLDVPAHRIHIAKYRAIQRMRGHPAWQAFLQRWQTDDEYRSAS